jgi:hypothetical protein
LSSDEQRFLTNDEEQGLDENYGSYNVAPFTKIRCPACGRTVWVARGQEDVTHDCTIICPHSGDEMLPIPGDPAQAKVRLVFGSNAEMAMDSKWVQSFYYCPSSSCPYFLQYGAAYMQKRVLTDILIGR